MIIKNKMKVILILGLVFLLSFTSACGWFIYEDFIDDDIPTRAYYNIFDEIEGVEDGVLMISREPTLEEREKNVYVPSSFHLRFQGPVPEDCNESYFRETGKLEC